VFYVAYNGLTVRAIPDMQDPMGRFDEQIDGKDDFPRVAPQGEWFTLTHGIDSEGELVGVNDNLRFFTHGDPRDGYVSLAAGRVLIQTWLSVVQIEQISVEPAINLRGMANLPTLTTDRSRRM
jgi:hypothetical protein